MLSIEIWDTGMGIPDGEIHAIFDEYHQIDNAARERKRGLGLGLSIVRRLASLLGHPIHVTSQVGKGSVFSIEVTVPTRESTPPSEKDIPATLNEGDKGGSHTGSILVVEDDPEISGLLELFLNDVGYRTITVSDGTEALDIIERDDFRPDLILADYNLPGGMDGIAVAEALRNRLHRRIPIIILTGDISTSALQKIALQDCVQLSKPVKTAQLTKVVERLLAHAALTEPTRSTRSYAAKPAEKQESMTIFVVDDNRRVRETMREVLEDHGWVVEDFESCEKFLEAFRPQRPGCLLLDAYLPEMSGLELLQTLKKDGTHLPVIMITGAADVTMAVEAMKAGAIDFVEKPIAHDDLLACVTRALEQDQGEHKLTAWQESAATHAAGLTPRQRQIMDLVVAGHPSKNIAADLGISQRTVENHRASIMKRMGAKSIPELARFAFAAATKR